MGGRNRHDPSFSPDPRVSQSIIISGARELVPPPSPLSPSPLAPTRASSPSISSFFSVCRTILSLCVALRVISLPHNAFHGQISFASQPLSPFPHKPEPVLLSRILSNSVSHHPDDAPPLSQLTTGRTMHCLRVITTFGAPAAATSWNTLQPRQETSAETRRCASKGRKAAGRRRSKGRPLPQQHRTSLMGGSTCHG